MYSVFDAVANTINRRPHLVAGLIVGLLILALIGASLTTMETGMSTYVDENTERGMLLQKYVDNFQTDSVLILIEADNVLTPDLLAYMERLEGELSEERYVTGVTGIADLMKQANGGVLPTSYAEINRVKILLPAETVSGLNPSPMMTIVAVGVEPGMSQDATFGLLDSIHARIALSSPPPGVTITATGESAFAQQMMNEMGVSMSLLLLAAMVLMVIAVGLFFSHVRYRLLSVFIVGTGVLFTFGFMGLTGMKISMVVIGAFPVLIGIGIDYAIQFHSRFDEEARKSSLAEAVKTTVTKTGPSVLYAMLATCMGFLALWVAPIPMIQGFGMVCVIGLISCYLAALVIVPTAGVLLRYRPIREPSATDNRSTLMERYNERVGRLARKVANHPVPVILACVMIAVVGIQLDNQIIINTDEKTFVPSDMPAKIQLDKVTRAMGPSGGIPIFVQGDGILTVDGLTWMQEFQEYEETHNTKVTGSRSIVDVIKAYNGGMLPDTNQEIQYILEQIPDDVKDRYLSGNSIAVIDISMVQMENNVAMAALDGIQRDLSWKEPPPGITARITGMGEMFTNLIREIATGKLLMTLFAFGLILAFLYAVYRKFGRAITPIVPIVLIVGWNGLIMFVLGIDYTPMTATLGSMTIGVASEYTILIMERAYEERKSGTPLVPAIQHAVSQIGTAITISGLTTVFGFAALTLSAFNIISNFGMVTVITVAFTLVGAIVVMPAILSLVGSYEDRQGHTTVIAEDVAS
jgi:hydrophobe/amphiphile efflux-3 (HAE3) family protein